MYPRGVRVLRVYVPSGFLKTQVHTYLTQARSLQYAPMGYTRESTLYRKYVCVDTASTHVHNPSTHTHESFQKKLVFN